MDLTLVALPVIVAGIAVLGRGLPAAHRIRWA